MIFIDSTITLHELKEFANEQFGNIIKAVVDIEKQVMVIGAPLHADEEAFLLEKGSKQENLWGINLYPGENRENLIEFDSMINLRPSQGNSSRGVDNPQIREKIISSVDKLIKQ